MKASTKQEHRDRGIHQAEDSERVTISLNGTWSAKLKNGGNCTSYEKIGYHAGSKEFIEGVLSTECEVYRCKTSETGSITLLRILSIDSLADLFTN